MENGNLRPLKEDASVSSSIQSYDSDTSSSGYLRARATPVKHSNQPINTKEHRKKAEVPRVSKPDLSSEDVSYENDAKEDDHLYESIKQLRRTMVCYAVYWYTSVEIQFAFNWIYPLPDQYLPMQTGFIL